MKALKGAGNYLFRDYNCCTGAIWYPLVMNVRIPTTKREEQWELESRISGFFSLQAIRLMHSTLFIIYRNRNLEIRLL